MNNNNNSNSNADKNNNNNRNINQEDDLYNDVVFCLQCYFGKTESVATQIAKNKLIRIIALPLPPPLLLHVLLHLLRNSMMISNVGHSCMMYKDTTNIILPTLNSKNLLVRANDDSK